MWLVHPGIQGRMNLLNLGLESYGQDYTEKAQAEKETIIIIKFYITFCTKSTKRVDTSTEYH